MLTAVARSSADETVDNLTAWIDEAKRLSDEYRRLEAEATTALTAFAAHPEAGAEDYLRCDSAAAMAEAELFRHLDSKP